MHTLQSLGCYSDCKLTHSILKKLCNGIIYGKIVQTLNIFYIVSIERFVH